MSTCPLSTANRIAVWIKPSETDRSVRDAEPTSRSTAFTGRIAPKEEREAVSQFDDLPMIQCPPQPVPVGHPEHPDFKGYDDIPVDPPWAFRGYADLSDLSVLNSLPGWTPEE